MNSICYLCGSSRYTKIHYGVRGNTDIDVIKCTQCGLVRLSDFISDTEDFYRNSEMRRFDKEQDIKKIRVEALDDDNRRFKYTKNKIANKTLLDFGCGAGGYLNEAQNVAKKVYGIELETEMWKFLCEEGIKCFPSIDKAEKELTEKVDVITLWHVLEHLEDPIHILERLGRLLKPNGVIIIEVPNAEDALSTLYENKEYKDFTYWECHLFLYNNDTLREVVKKAGMQVRFQTQIQRYPLSNHLYWLTNGRPGGHVIWDVMNRDGLNDEYEKMLVSIGKADTLLIEIEKNDGLYETRE